MHAGNEGRRDQLFQECWSRCVTRPGHQGAVSKADIFIWVESGKAVIAIQVGG